MANEPVCKSLKEDFCDVARVALFYFFAENYFKVLS